MSFTSGWFVDAIGRVERGGFSFVFSDYRAGFQGEYPPLPRVHHDDAQPLLQRQ